MSYYFEPESVQIVSIEKCYEYSEFDLYGEEELDNLESSIKAVGIIEPMIARITDKGYQIIIGRRRFRALIKSNMHKVPLIVRDITNEDIEVLIVESKLTQQGVGLLKHSQLALLISRYHEKLKAQGRRTDLLREVDYYEDQIINSNTLNVSRLNSAEESGLKFKLSSRSISRYLRLHQLCRELKDVLDKDLISIRVGVELSYLTYEEQYYISGLINKGHNIKLVDAVALRELSSKTALNKVIIRKILSNKREKSSLISSNIYLSEMIMKYSLYKYDEGEIRNILDEALQMYFSSRCGVTFKVGWMH